MKLENQQVNLELSKQLEKAGYPQKGLWWWHLSGFMGSEKWSLIAIDKYPNWAYEDPIVAPTVAELGKRLPDAYHSSKSKGVHACIKVSEDGKNSKIVVASFADTEANSRAKCWLYLKKGNKLL